ncbi:MAG: hypothetical protein ACP5HG_06360 [Anaerolineae bacterium]
MHSPTSGQTVVADFFAQGYRVSGVYVEGKLSLPDAVYDQSTDYLLIQEAYLSPITDPAKISVHYTSTTLAKQNLDFILTLEQQDGLRRDQRYSLGRSTFDLCLTVPFFEIRGRLHTANRSFDPRVFLSAEAGPFITLLDVTASCTFNPSISYSGGAALINRQSIGFLGEREGDEA